MSDGFNPDEMFDGGFAESSGGQGVPPGDVSGFSADFDGDGLTDFVMESVDLNNDGVPDISTLDVDINADGLADVSITGMDVDGDGVDDLVSMQIDTDGDGFVDEQYFEGDVDAMLAVSDASHDVWGDMASESVPADGTPGQLDSGEGGFEALSLTYDELTFDGFEDFYAIHGTPIEDMSLWDPQDDPNSCAVATTSMMFASLGLEVSEDVLAEEFLRQGIYDVSSGTDPRLMPDAINEFAFANGLEVEAFNITATTVEDFEQALDAGFRPLVSIDFIEIYGSADDKLLNDFGLVPDAGHAVQLIGIEHTPDGSYAIFNDPDVSAGMRVPVDVFMEATADFGGLCVAMGGKEAIEALPNSLESGNDRANVALAGMTEPLHSDVFGRIYRGSSPFPIGQHSMF